MDGPTEEKDSIDISVRICLCDDRWAALNMVPDSKLWILDEVERRCCKVCDDLDDPRDFSPDPTGP
jgi:hypothetical protein